MLVFIHVTNLFAKRLKIWCSCSYNAVIIQSAHSKKHMNYITRLKIDLTYSIFFPLQEFKLSMKQKFWKVCITVSKRTYQNVWNKTYNLGVLFQYFFALFHCVTSIFLCPVLVYFSSQQDNVFWLYSVNKFLGREYFSLKLLDFVQSAFSSRKLPIRKL